jgi:hypothetical protein
MLNELEIARAHLARHGGIAAAARRLGIEWTGAGYRTLARVKRMERRIKLPVDLEVIVLNRDPRQAEVTCEYVDKRGMHHRVICPEIAVLRHARRRAFREGRQ